MNWYIRVPSRVTERISIGTSSSAQNENFVSTCKNLPEKRKLNSTHSALFHMKTRVCLKYFTNDYRPTIRENSHLKCTHVKSFWSKIGVR